jgi:hypothetical protein
MGTAWEVANTALFLASNEPNYVTGVRLPVDAQLSRAVGEPIPESGCLYENPAAGDLERGAWLSKQGIRLRPHLLRQGRPARRQRRRRRHQ